MTSPGKMPVKNKNGEFIWTITIAIPREVFFHHKIKKLTGKTFMANFYKCGDKLPEPHYVTWNPVETPAPDFHQPGYFGLLRFMPGRAGRIASEEIAD
jgi:Carbohydrate-binding family 9